MYKFRHCPTPGLSGSSLGGVAVLGGALQKAPGKGVVFGPAESFPERLCWRAAAEAVTLVAPSVIVELEEAVEVPLDLGHLLLPGVSTGDAEAFVEQRAVHPLGKAVGTG